MTDLAPILERLATVLERPPLPPDRILWHAALRVSRHANGGQRAMSWTGSCTRWVTPKRAPR